MKLIYPHFTTKTKTGLMLKTSPSFIESLSFYKALKNNESDFEFYSGVPYSKKAVSHFKNYFKNFHCCFSINRNRKFVGYVALSPKNSENKEFVIEFYVLKQYRRQNIAYNAVGAVIQLAINFFDDIEKIHAVAIYSNIPAENLLRKLGFQHVGEQHNILVVDGKIYNPLCVQYTLEL